MLTTILVFTILFCEPIATVYAADDVAIFAQPNNLATAVNGQLEKGKEIAVFEYVETDLGPYYRCSEGYIPARQVVFDIDEIEWPEPVVEEVITPVQEVINYATPQNGSGLTKQSGVNYYDERRETYYSSRVLYHYRTPEWYLDEEGFYHDVNGFYVVAASDMAQGTTFPCSKGTCIVLDSGCAPGTTDYYVAW